MKLVARFRGWSNAFRESPWFYVAWKSAAGLAVLGVLALVGMGQVRALVPKAAQASPGNGPSGHGSEPVESAREAAVAPPRVSASAIAPAPRADAGSALVVLNSASEAELDKLPGIGPSTAARIVALREKMGRFKRVEDLLRVKGIKRRLLAKIKPFVSVDAVDPASLSSASPPPREPSR